MPGSRRRHQCAFKEGRIRCRRDGHGSPPLCGPHRLLFEEQARRAEQPRSGIGVVFDLVDDFLSGRQINSDKVAGVIDNLAEAWGMGGAYGAHHEVFDEDPLHANGEFQHERDNRRRAPRDRVYEAPLVNELAEQRAAIARAKVALGFAAGEPLTRDQVKQRHRELARRHHPDRGGSLAKMQAINAAVDLLEKSL